MKAKLSTLAVSAALLSSLLGAQDVLAVKAGTLYQGRGEKILKNAVILVEDGRIKAIGSDVEIPWNATVLEAAYVMPAWILAHGSGGLDNANENIQITPYLSVLDSLDPSSTFFENSRRSGVAALHILPGNNCQIGGRGMLVRPKGKTPEEMAIVEEAGMKMSLQAKSGSRSVHLSKLKKALDDAIAHKKDIDRQEAEWKEDKANGATTEDSFDREDKLDPLKAPLLDLLARKITAYLYVPGPNDVPAALELVRKYDLETVLILGPRCYKAVGIIKKAMFGDKLNLKLILDPILELIEKDPITQEESMVCTARVFYDANIPFALSSTASSGRGRFGRRFGRGGGTSSNPALALPLWQVATCVRNGIPEDIAIAAFTEMPARILGREKQIGKIAVGMEADFQLLNTGPMEPECQVEKLVVGGEVIYDRSKDPRVKALTGKPGSKN